MKRGVLIGAIAGAVVLILLWYFVLFSPTSSDLSDTRGQVAAAQSQKQELENTIAHLKELSANAAQQQASLRTLRAAVPPTPDLGAFILQANDIATSTGIDWLSIAPTPPTATVGPGPTSTIGLSMQISGGFFEVLDYLNHLEDLERVVVVDTINVAAAGADSGSTGAGTGSSGSTGASSGGAPDLNVTLTGRMFTNAAPAPVAGSPTTPGTATTPTTTPGGSTSSTTPPASSSGSSS